jgi:hypothetical protein
VIFCGVCGTTQVVPFHKAIYELGLSGFFLREKAALHGAENGTWSLETP